MSRKDGQMVTERAPSSEAVQLGAVPLVSVAMWATLTGTPLGVAEAHADRRLIPIYRVGKYRYVNLEVLRQRALSAEVGA
jgi:hypothetical protein